MADVIVDGNGLTIEDVVLIARNAGASAALSDSARESIARSRRGVEAFLAAGERVYGITTGFGALKDHFITPDHSRELQRNMIMSHSVGVGEPFPEEVVRGMLLVRANALAKGYSGIRLSVVQALLDLLDRGVYPVIPAKGSVGSSGDLAPLSHLTLTLIGLGEAVYEGKRMASAEALSLAGLAPVVLEAKEGLALINGTTAMTAVAALAVHDAENLAATADVAGAMSLEAMQGVPAALDARLHAARPYPGQIAVAANLRALIDGSDLVSREREGGAPARVHDAYCLRCMPQVHGAVRDAIDYVRQVVTTELNSATDNPLLFVEEGDGSVTPISGGNFHGEPIALAMDFLGIAVAELGSISERRIARLVDAHANEGSLPPFLTPSSGLHSGFMLAQYVAAALVSENKVLAHPASVDSIPTSAGMEDHVSMGTIAARQAREILGNVMNVLSIELMAGAQGIDLRLLQTPARPGRGTVLAHQALRKGVPFLEADAVMYPHLAIVREMVAAGEFAGLLRTWLL
jgi:histidine ammonia-lyase